MYATTLTSLTSLGQGLTIVVIVEGFLISFYVHLLSGINYKVRRYFVSDSLGHE